MTTLQYPTETKARKEHQCNFCYDKIRVKEPYIRSTHVFDGEIYTWKTHTYCAKLADRLNMYDDCEEGLGGEEFKEYVSDKHFKILWSQIPDDAKEQCRDIANQLGDVKFKDKMWFVIRHFNKLEKAEDLNLLRLHGIGWDEEMLSKPTKTLENPLEQRAYDMGRLDYKVGDDVPSADCQTPEQIIKYIRNKN